MRSSRGKYTGIQDDGSSFSPYSSLWRQDGNDSSRLSTNTSRYSYQSIRSTGSTAQHPPSSSSEHFGTSSIRNSAHSRSIAWGMRQFRWCVACYETKFVTIEPVLFVVMFAVYLHKIVSELYIFNEFARRAFDAHITPNETRENRSMECARTSVLNNFSYMESMYDVDLLWKNRTGDVVESDTGILIMIINVAMGAFSIFGTLMLGPLSNRFGRKAVMLGILGGLVLQSLITVLITELEIDVHFLILGAAIRGLTGGVAGIYTVSYSYITEFSQDKKKWLVVRIGAIETLSFVAVSLGLSLGGVAIGELKCDFSVPAFVVLGCVTCLFLYVAIATSDTPGQQVAGESPNRTPPPRAEKEKKVHASPRALLQGAGMFVKKGYPRFKLWLSLLVMVVTVVNSSGVTAIITLFLLHKPLELPPVLIGGYLGLSDFIHGLVLVVVLPLLLSAGIHDGTIVSLSIMLTLAMNVTLGFVNYTWQVFVVGAIQSVEVLIVPTLKAMLSKAVPAQDKGALFAFISVVQVLSAMFGSLLYIPIYILSLNDGWPSEHSSGASFLLMALIYVFTLPLMCILSLSQYIERRRQSRFRPIINDGFSTGISGANSSADVGWSQPPPPLQAKHGFEASIGQDLVDREGSLQYRQSPDGRGRQEERNRDLLEHSYSSLSEYHSYKQ